MLVSKKFKSFMMQKLIQLFTIKALWTGASWLLEHGIVVGVLSSSLFSVCN